jgi:DNA (cytosine-5)-methyltransferase 1
MRFGSLFAGIGGIDLGLERAGMTCAWQSEIDPYACRVLRKHWPDVPNLGDITQIDFRQVTPVDVIAGGFPCQDLSKARTGQRTRGRLDGEKSGLWTEYRRAVRDLRPRYVLVENVTDLLHGGLDRVLGDLAELGYDAWWRVLAAANVAAPHIRERLFVVAHPCGERDRLPPQQIPTGGHFPEHGAWWEAEPGVDRVADGVPAQVDRLRGLGNAVVPQVAELIGGWIVAHAAATADRRAA